MAVSTTTHDSSIISCKTWHRSSREKSCNPDTIGRRGRAEAGTLHGACTACGWLVPAGAMPTALLALCYLPHLRLWLLGLV